MAIVKPKKTLRGMELDMRHSPLEGADLKEEIAESVAHTQAFILTELPNWLVITRKQWNSMVDAEDALKLNDNIWQTPLNVMDVDIDTSGDTLGLIDLTEAEL